MRGRCCCCRRCRRRRAVVVVGKVQVAGRAWVVAGFKPGDFPDGGRGKVLINTTCTARITGEEKKLKTEMRE
jgi:hypothetical protein